MQSFTWIVTGTWIAWLLAKSQHFTCLSQEAMNTWKTKILLSEKSVLRIRDVYPGSHPRSRIRIFPIPDRGSRIRIKELKYFNPKKGFLSSRKYDPGCSSLIRIPDPDSEFFPIPDPDPGSRGQKGTGSLIRAAVKNKCLKHCLAILRAIAPINQPRSIFCFLLNLIPGSSITTQKSSITSK